MSWQSGPTEDYNGTAISALSGDQVVPDKLYVGSAELKQIKQFEHRGQGRKGFKLMPLVTMEL